jgi:hypothetical protein
MPIIPPLAKLHPITWYPRNWILHIKADGGPNPSFRMDRIFFTQAKDLVCGILCPNQRPKYYKG